MSMYDLHTLIFDVHSDPAIRETFLSNPEMVCKRYTLNEQELAALGAMDIYRLECRNTKPATRHRRRPPLALGNGRVPSVPRQSAAAARSKAQRGPAQPENVAQDGVG
jgi:hypothetical protein